MKHNGFTLVELAIVLMVIGLLIGGILKGQELIQNARIIQFTNQLQQIDAAVFTFQDSYNALPGDMTNPSTRLPNCSTASCILSGNEDGIVGVINSAGDNENLSFWQHLNAAHLLSGAQDGFHGIPVALGGTVRIMWLNTPAAPNTRSEDGRYGHHLVGIYNADNTVSDMIETRLIGRLDSKIDDGRPWRGRVKMFNQDYGIAFGDADYSAVTNDPVHGRFLIRTAF